jgi:hypothetical protein
MISRFHSRIVKPFQMQLSSVGGLQFSNSGCPVESLDSLTNLPASKCTLPFTPTGPHSEAFGGDTTSLGPMTPSSHLSSVSSNPPLLHVRSAARQKVSNAYADHHGVRCRPCIGHLGQKIHLVKNTGMHVQMDTCYLCIGHCGSPTNPLRAALSPGVSPAQTGGKESKCTSSVCFSCT